MFVSPSLIKNLIFVQHFTTDGPLANVASGGPNTWTHAVPVDPPAPSALPHSHVQPLPSSPMLMV